MTVAQRNLFNSIAVIAIASGSIASASAALIAPTGATQTAGGSGVYGSLLLVRNGAGLSGSGPVASQLHNERPDTSMWLVNGTVATVVFDLGAVYQLDQMVVWNYSEGTYGFGSGIGGPLGFNGSVRGAKDVNVYYSDTNPDPTGSFIYFPFDQAVVPANSTVVGGAAGFGEDFGVAGVTYSFPTTITAQYIKFDILTNIGGSVIEQNNYVGLSEVRFNVVPEPTAAWLLICGTISTVLLVRRRAIAKKALLIGALSAAFAGGSSVEAATIILDTFSGTNGSAINGRTPDTTNLPNGNWAINGTNGYILDIQGNEARVGADVGATIPISTNFPYTKPTELTISATFNLNTLVATDAYFSRAFGLGFFSAQNVNAGSGFNFFRGVTVRKNGDVALLNGVNGDVAGVQAYTGTFDTTIDHTLTYTIDTTTGGILSASFDGQSRSFTTTLFSPTNTAFAGFYASSNDGTPASLAFVDQFTLQTVPEPSSIVLSCFSAATLLALRRRRQG